ncbi:hypothetical protein L7F22_028640 [Adiantum nelumboides]|nr:hypothetical protein [Adiantum nelumboides]
MDHGYGGHPYGTCPQQFPPPPPSMHGVPQQFAQGAAPPTFFPGPPAAAMGGFPPYGPSIPYPPAAGPFAPPPAPLQQQVPIPLAFFNPWEPPPHIVPPPADPELQKRIEKLVEYAAKNGPEFEKMLKEKQKDNPLYAFLFGAEGFAYYRYKLWITVNPHLGGPFMNPPPPMPALSAANPNFNPTLAALNSGIGPVNPGLNPLNAPMHSVLPPFYDQPHPIAQPHHQPPYFEPPYQESVPKSFKGLSGPLPTDVAMELQSVLENLTGTKESIKGAKNWFMQRLPFAPALAEALRERVLALDDDIWQLHVIYLANDILFDRESDPNFSAAHMASGEGQSNPSTSGDAGGDHNEDYGNEYGPPLPTQEELREMEHRRIVGEATNMMLNFAKDPKLAQYVTETAFQDVHA